MSIPAIFVVFSVTWFLALYCLLPVRIRSREEAGDEIVEGAMKGAPSNPNLRLKAVGATIISGIITAIAYYVITYRIVTLDTLERTLG